MKKFYAVVAAVFLGFCLFGAGGMEPGHTNLSQQYFEEHTFVEIHHVAPLFDI